MSNIINIGGGAGSGSSVVPNPQGTATDTLTKLGIEGTIYDFAGSGGGGSYIDTDTVIQAQTAIPANTDITYTATQDCVVVYYINIVANSTGVVSVDGVSIDGGWRTTLTGLRGCVFLTTGQTITLRQTYTTEDGVYTVYGILGGSSGSSGHNYSTTEQVVGTWIDGSTIYEQSFAITNLNISTGWTVLVSSISIDKLISGEVCISGGGYDYTWNALYHNNGNIAVYNFLGGAIQSANGYVTIRYTKTST